MALAHLPGVDAGGGSALKKDARPFLRVPTERTQALQVIDNLEMISGILYKGPFVVMSITSFLLSR